MDSRNPFSKGLKKLKHKLAEGSRKLDPRPERENDREKREANVERGGASQRNSHLHSEVEDVVESGPNREENDVDGKEVGQIDPPASAPSILHSGELDGM